MAYYKIKNLTSHLTKRHIYKNSTLDIEYQSGFDKKVHKLPVGAEIYISCGNLPISVHKLRIKKLVSVREVSQNEFFKAQKPKSQPVIKEEVVEVEPTKVELENDAVEDKNESEEEKPTRTYKRKKKKEEPTVISNPTEE